MTNALKISTAVIALGFTASGFAQTETTVFSDNFEDGNRNGWYARGGETTGTIGVSTETHISGNYSLQSLGSGTGSTNYRPVLAHFSPVTLSNAGDSLTLNFSYQGILYSGNNANRFVFGLYNSLGLTTTADGQLANGTTGSGYPALGSGRSDGYIGYGGQIRSDARDQTVSDPVSFGMRGAGAGGGVTTPLSSQSGVLEDGARFHLQSHADNSFLNINDTFNFSLTISRNASSGLDLTAVYTNTNGDKAQSVTITYTVAQAALAGWNPDNPSVAYTFDTIAFGNSNNRDLQYLIDDVKVINSTTIPEPSTSVALAGFACLTGAVLLRRRAQRASSGE